MEYDAAIVDPELDADLSSLSTPPQPPVASSSPPLPPPAPHAAAPRAVRRLGIGEQLSSESSPPRSLERPPSPQAQNPPPLAAGQYPPRERREEEEELCYNSFTEDSFTEDDSTSDGHTRSSQSYGIEEDSQEDFYPLPTKVFRNGSVYFHKSYNGPRPLGFVNTRLYEGHSRDYFIAYTPRDLVWARRMDYVLRRHNLEL
jgi:hypothetical protein